MFMIVWCTANFEEMEQQALAKENAQMGGGSCTPDCINRDVAES